MCARKLKILLSHIEGGMLDSRHKDYCLIVVTGHYKLEKGGTKMKARFSKRSFMQLALCCALVTSMAFIGGCKGSSGSDGAPGADGVSAPPANSTGIKATITSAVVDSATGSVVVNFTLTDS